MLAAGAALGVLAWGAPGGAAPVLSGVELGSASVMATGSVTTVNQASQRAVIDWHSFNVAGGESVNFLQNLGGHSAITFNRVDPTSFSTISGSITAQGGVWIFSPAGILIGNGAQIDVGSFVASTGDIGASCNSCLSGGTILITGAKGPPTVPGGGITVQSGAQINANAGFALFDSESITQDGHVTATDGVAYILGDNANISFDDGAPGGPSGPIGPMQQILAVDLSNSDTTANASMVQGAGAGSTGAWVGVFAPDEGVGGTGFSGVINLSGVIEATGVAPAGIAGAPGGAVSPAVVLVGAPASTNTAYNYAFSVDTSGAQITGDAGGLRITAGSANLGPATVAGQAAVIADGPITVGPGVTIRADSGGSGDAYAYLRSGKSGYAGGSINLDPTSLIAAGKPGDSPSSPVLIESFGGDVTVGAVQGSNVRLRAIQASGPASGAVTIDGAVLGPGYVTVLADFGAVNVNANLSSAGQITVTAGPSEPIVIGPNVVINSDNGATGAGGPTGAGVYIIAGGSITADKTSSIFAGASATAPQDVARIYAGLSGSGNLTLGAVSGTDVTLSAPRGDVTLDGYVLGANSLRIDPINLAINANVTTGGYLNLYVHNAITIAPSVTVRSDSAGVGGRDLRVEAGSVNADPTSTLVAGPLVGPPTSRVTVYADGGDLSVGNVRGTTVILDARGASGGSGPSGGAGGSLFIGGEVLGTTSVSARSEYQNVTIAAPTGGAAGISSGGAVTVYAYDNITIGPAVVINSDSGGVGGAGVSITGYSIDADATSLILAGAKANLPTSSIDIFASGNLTLGAVSGTDVTLSAPTGNVTLDGDVLGSTSLIIDPTNLYINANVTTGGSLDLTAVNAIDIAAGVTVRSDSTGGGAGDMLVEATTVDADPTSTLVAGPLVGPPTSRVTVYADGGALSVGNVQGTSVLLDARGATGGSGPGGAYGGSLTIGGEVLGTTSVTARSEYANVTVQAPAGGKAGISSGGAITIYAYDNITIGPAVTINSDTGGTGGGGISITGYSIDADATSLILAGTKANLPTSSIDIYASGNLTLGAVSGTDVTLSAPTGNVTLNGDVLGSTNLIIDPANIYINANVTSGGPLDLNATNAIDIAAGVTVRSDSTGGGAGDMMVEATTVDADPTSTLVAGPLVGPPTSRVTVYADGGNLSVGAVRGTNVLLEARGPTGASGPTGATGGNLFIGGQVLGTKSVTALSYYQSVSVQAGVSSGGPITISAYTALTVGPGIIINSDTSGSGTGALTISAGSVDADPTSTLVAGPVGAPPTSSVTVTTYGGDIAVGNVQGATVTLGAGGNLIISGQILGTSYVGAFSDGGNVSIASVGKNSAGIASGGGVTVYALDAVTIGPNVVINSDTGGVGAGGVNILALTGPITADATSLILGGAKAGAPASPVVVYSGGDLTLGQVSGTDVTLTATGNTTLNGAVLGSTSVIIDPTNLYVNANVTSGGTLALNATNAIDIAAGVTVRSDLSGGGAGDMTVEAATVDANPTSTLVAGPLVGPPTSRVTVYADGGNLSVGAVRGTNVLLEARGPTGASGPSGATGGNLTIGGQVLGTKSVTAISYYQAVSVQAGVSSGGPITISAYTALTVGPGILINSDTSGSGTGALTISAASVDADPTSTLVAGPVGAPPTSSVTVTTSPGDIVVGNVQGATVTLGAGGNLTINGQVMGVSYVGAFSDGGNVSIASVGKNSAGIASGGGVTVYALDAVTIGPNVVINSDTGGVGAGGVNILALTGPITADATSLILGGAKAGAPASPVVVYSGGDLTLGQVSGTDVTLSTPANATLNGYVFGSTSVVIDPTNLYVNANVTSGGTLDLNATNAIDIAAGVTVRSDLSGGGAGDMRIEAATVDADPTSTLVAGPLVGPPTSRVSVYADGGNLSVGAVRGTTVLLEARGPSGASGPTGASGGSLFIGGQVLGTTSVTAISDYQGANVQANVSSAGPITITGQTGITVGPSVTINSDSGGGPTGAAGVTLTANNGPVSADKTSLILAGTSAAAPGDFVTITAGGDLTLGAVAGTDVTMTTTGNVTLNGVVYGSTSVVIDPTNIFINANLTSGGTLSLNAVDAIDINKAVTVRSDAKGGGAGDMTLEATTIDADPTSLIVAGPLVGPPTSSVSVYADGDSLSVGAVQGTAILLQRRNTASGPLLGNIIVGGQIDGTKSVTIIDSFGDSGTTSTAPTGGIEVDAAVTSGGAVQLTAWGEVTIAAGVTVRSDSGGAGGASLSVEGAGVNADPTSLMAAGPTVGAPTSAVSVFADGFFIAAGAVQGTDVLIEARAQIPGGCCAGAAGGPVSIAGPVLGIKSVTLISEFGDVDMLAGAASGGALTITAADAVNVSPGVVIQADSGGTDAGGLTLTATSGAVTADTTSLILAGPSASAPTDFVTVSAGGNLTLGAVSGTDVTLTTPGDATLNGNVLGSTSVTIDPNNIFVNANVTSGGFLDLTAVDAINLGTGASLTAAGRVDATAGSISLGAASVVRSDSAGKGAGGVDLAAGGNFTADKTSLVVAGTDPSAPSDTVTISAGNGGAGGNLTAGQVSGTLVSLTTTGGSGEGGGGDLLIGGAVLGTQGVTAYSNPGDSGAQPGKTEVAANVTSGGTIDIRAEGSGGLTLDAGVAVTSSGGEVYLASNHDLTVGSEAQVSGIAFAGVAQGVLQVASGASIVTTGTAPAPTWPTAPATIVASTNEGVRTPTVTELNLAAGTLDIQGDVTAGSSEAREDIFIQALGAPALVTVGGTGGTGFQLTNSDFTHLTGRNILVMAGDGEGGAHNADIQLADLTLDSSKASGLWLGTSSDHAIDVVGQTTVTGTGPMAVRLGFVRTPASAGSGPSGPLVGFIPGQIDISGALGAPSAPLSDVSLLARNDIFIGTSAFITAAAGDATFDAVAQSKNFPGLPQGSVFIAAGALQLAAQGRIIQENTSTLTVPDSSAYGGLTIDAPTPADPLILAPSALDGATIGSGGWTANYQAGPTRIDVFGILIQPGGTTTSGVDAALQSNLLDTAITTSNAYRINSCVFGSHCITIPPPTFEPPPDQIFDNPLPVLSFESDITLPDTDDDDQKKNAVPITESGNGDLWADPKPSNH